MRSINESKIGVIGLGYVGLPLALALAKKYKVVGFDIDEKRIKELQAGKDHTHQVNIAELQLVGGQNLALSYYLEEVRHCNVFIITVPTPVDQFKQPDLQPLLKASKMVGNLLKKGDMVIYESTVYPGCTEEDCVPVLEEVSRLKYNVDFFCGYSPERINPGDKKNTLPSIKKITSGSNLQAAEFVDQLYKNIITAGTYKAASIKVAEAAKAIENAQRDINISFVNELALIFDRMGIDTGEVLEAAGTKWNFLPFKPGLVGGHCIGVDPYYLAHKSESLGYFPQVILSGRKVNDNMGIFVANKLVKLMTAAEKPIKGSKVLILGFAFKENCPDTRNTKVIDIYNELKSFGIHVTVFDPVVNPQKVSQDYGISLAQSLDFKYDGVILAVVHQQFADLDFEAMKQSGAIIFDTKSFLPKTVVAGRL